MNLNERKKERGNNERKCTHTYTILIIIINFKLYKKKEKIK